MPFPEFWVILDIETWNDGFSMFYRVYTDIAVYLVMHWTYDEPSEERLPQRSRGTTERHNVKRDLRTWYEDYQAEYGDTYVHTYKVPFAWIYKTVYIRFEGFILDVKSLSRSPIFTSPIHIPWEPWDMGLTGRHPWTSDIFGPAYIEFSGGYIMFSVETWAWGPARVSIGVRSFPPADPLFDGVPHYFLDKTLPGIHRTPPSAYIVITIGPVYRLYWYLRYDWATTHPGPWPVWATRSRRMFIDWGEHTIDLHADLAELADHEGASLLTPDIPIVAIGVTIVYSNSPWWYQNLFQQDYIDFRAEAPP